MLAYAKATAAQLLEIEQSYSLMLRHSLSCDASFPCTNWSQMGQGTWRPRHSETGLR